MPLRDALNRLREQDQHRMADRQRLIADWQADVDALFKEFHGYLSEYEADHSLVFRDRRVHINEEVLGTYDISALDIKVSSILISVRPVGRLIVGAEGRVDMHRQGRSSEEHRVMFLKAPMSSEDTTLRWFIKFPPDVTSRRAVLYPSMRPEQKVALLSKESLEEAIEVLLR